MCEKKFQNPSHSLRNTSRPRGRSLFPAWWKVRLSHMVTFLGFCICWYGKKVFSHFSPMILPSAQWQRQSRCCFFHHVDELMEVQSKGQQPQSKAYPGSTLLCQTLTPPLMDGTKRWKYQRRIWDEGVVGAIAIYLLYVMLLTISTTNILDGSHWVLTMFPWNID